MADRADDVTRLIAGGGALDPVEERQALADVRSELFGAAFRPIALDRYVLLEPLGSGAAGVVYRAYDPDLHRQVAIKVLRTGAGSSGVRARDRLLREAQAIAQLSHPNVVAVFDLGTVTPETGLEPGVYVVMELVEGETLREWLRRPREPAEILRVFVAAGRGLEAAHRRDLVHRDFKPGNVLIGNDGRVRVADFGLARVTTSGATSDSEESAGSSGPGPILNENISQDGIVVGTPPYMAPEQHVGTPADARADQYGFCVSLWEALYGVRPFRGKKLEDLARAKRVGPGQPPEAPVPRWIHALLVRGLDPDPERRYPGMSELLARLERDPVRRRRQVLAGVLVAAAAVLGGVGIGLASDSGAACADGEARVAEIWTPAIESEVREAFEGQGTRGAEIWPMVESGVDAYVEQWIAVRADVCEKARRGEQSAEDLGRQTVCLERQLDGFGAVARVLSRPDERVVANSLAMVSRLPPPEKCRSPGTAQERADSGPGSRDRMLEIDGELLRARVLKDAGKYDESLDLARATGAKAGTLGDALGEARGHLLACRVLWLENRFPEAGDECEAAVAAAERSGNDLLATEVLVMLGRVENGLNRPHAVERTYELAVARYAALPEGERDGLVEAQLATGLGHHLLNQRKYLEALAQMERARAAYERALGPDHPELVGVFNGMGLVHRGRNDVAAARGAYEKALTVVRKTHGPSHPLVASILHNRANLLTDTAEYARAVTELRDALAEKERTLGADSPRLVSTLYRLGHSLIELGRAEEAHAELSRAVSILERRYGRDSPLTATTLAYEARALVRLGRCQEALGALDRVESLIEGQTHEHYEAAGVLAIERARCALQRDDLVAARELLEESVRLRAELRGAEDRMVVEPLLELARVDRASGRLVEARQALERAVDVAHRTHGDPLETARVEYGLAQMLVETDRARALALATTARAALEATPRGAGELAELDTWLEAHR